MSKKLNPQQRKVVKALGKGLTMPEAMRIAKYSESSINNYSSKLYQKLVDKGALAQVFDEVGLDDQSIAEGIKTNIEAGMGVKATADTSLRGLELASKLKGHLTQEKEDTSTTNIYIKELKMLTNEQLVDKLKSIQGEVIELKEDKQ